MPNYNINDVEYEFNEFLNKLGIPPENGAGGAGAGGLKLDGRKHRYRITGDHRNQLNGEYCVYMDEWPAGYVKSYSAKHNVEYATWSFSAGGMEYIDEEKRAYREKREADVKARLEEERRRRDYAAKTAAMQWQNATVEGVSKHRYLLTKGITNCNDLKLYGPDIIVPLFDQFGEIWNVQRIAPDGAKKFNSGGRKRGCYYRLPCDGKYTFVCEGAATALSIREATGCPCLIAFDAGNLLPVIENIRGMFGNIVLAADNDRKTAGNPGMSHAIEAAYEMCIPVVSPQFEKPTDGSDWNDYAAIHGIEAASQEILRQIQLFISDTSNRRKFFFPDTYTDSKKKERAYATYENFEYLLRYHGYGVCYNEISRDAEINIPNIKFNAENRQNASLSSIYSLLAKHALKIEKNVLRSYMAAMAAVNSYNPAADYISSFKWDGQDNISRLMDTLILDDYDYDFAKLLLKKWLISGVAAAFARGKNENKLFWSRGVLVLLGQQAIGKTSWFRQLAPAELFAEGVSLSLDNKDDVKRAISCWITEFGELDGTLKRTDMARLKAFISNQYDDLRLPYAEKNEKLLRRTIFCASVNRPEILQDDTGSSRWWIIPVKHCNVGSVDIGQVWAHAYELYKHGEYWWLSLDDEAGLSKRNEKFEPSNKFEDLILSKFDFSNYSYEEWYSEYTTMEVMKICGITNPPPGECVSCSSVLRKLTGHKSYRQGKSRRRVFRMPLVFGIYQK